MFGESPKEVEFSRYEIGADFFVADLVNILPLSSDRKWIYLLQRREGGLATPSGQEPLKTMSPDEAAKVEMNHEAGHKQEQDIDVKRVATYKDKTISGSPKIAVYMTILDGIPLRLKNSKPETKKLQRYQIQKLKREQFSFPDQFDILMEALKSGRI